MVLEELDSSPVALTCPISEVAPLCKLARRLEGMKGDPLGPAGRVRVVVKDGTQAALVPGQERLFVAAMLEGTVVALNVFNPTWHVA